MQRQLLLLLGLGIVSFLVCAQDDYDYDYDPCENWDLSCQNGGHCTYDYDECICPKGFVGRECETRDPDFYDYDPCENWDLSCQNGGYCTMDEDVCICPTGFSGIECQEVTGIITDSPEGGDASTSPAVPSTTQATPTTPAPTTSTPPTEGPTVTKGKSDDAEVTCNGDAKRAQLLELYQRLLPVMVELVKLQRDMIQTAQLQTGSESGMERTPN